MTEMMYVRLLLRKLGAEDTSTSLKSFFSIYRNLFTRLAAEERLQSPDAEYPSFGYSTWPWAAVDPVGEGRSARDFYTVWINFATAKDFTWFEQWNISEAPDRRVRRYAIQFIQHLYGVRWIYIRLMEKDNKKARDDARRDYNDTVRVRAPLSLLCILS
jgi:DnaJ family protein A protein 5